MSKLFVTVALLPIYGNYGYSLVLYNVNGEPISYYWENHSKGTWGFREYNQ